MCLVTFITRSCPLPNYLPQYLAPGAWCDLTEAVIQGINSHTD